MPVPTSKWIRQALAILGLVIAAHAVGYMSGDWRPGGQAMLESIYVCRDDGGEPSLPDVVQGSTLHLCGVISGNVNWGAGMYIIHADRTLLSRRVQFAPGDFSLTVPIDPSWPVGQYKVQFGRAQNFVAEVTFEVVNGKATP